MAINNGRAEFTTPVGRMVGGNIYEPRTTDYDGKLLTVKTGPNAGQPRVEYSIGLAIPKSPGAQHWAQESWGAEIYALAQQSFPQGEWQRPDFAWKITDGDSTVPNKRNRRPCDQEGYKGHWVIWFSGSNAPRVYNANGTQQLVDKDAVKPGYYIQVAASCTDNKPSSSPGLYMNHHLVALSGYGPEIISGPDVSSAGFGQNVTLPPGASATPVGGGFNPAMPPVAGMPPMQAAPAAYTPHAGGMPPMQAAPGGIAAGTVQPNPAILQTPGLPPAAAPAQPRRTMTAKANGATYEQFIAQGWNDEQLIQHGYMVIS